jgi:hypothetical protein
VGPSSRALARSGLDIGTIVRDGANVKRYR